MGVTLFDILGIDRTLSSEERVERATGIWPSRKVHFLLGDIETSESVGPLVRYLQDSLNFRSITPGATPDTVGFYAEVEVRNPAAPVPVPLVIRTMPDVAFFLQDTGPGRPARCYVTKTKDAEENMEVVIEALPVEIQLPGGLLEPITETGNGEPPASLTNSFAAGVYDSYHVDLRTSTPSSIFVHLRIRVTRELDFVLEPAVVLSVGPCLFSGLPCFGLHDVSLIPAPDLKGDHEKVEQAIEWTRHTIEPAEAAIPGDTNLRGVLAVRTVDLDGGLSPMKELHEWMNSGPPRPGRIQFVLEDIVIPFFSILLLPIPIHGRLGIRRSIEFGDRFEEAYSFADAPIIIGLGGLILLIEEFILESFDPEADGNQFGRVNITLTGGGLPSFTTLNAAIDEAETTIGIEDAGAFSTVDIDETDGTSFILDRADPSKREIVVLKRKVSGNQLEELVRGQHKTTAVAHEFGATIEVDRFSNNAVTLGFTDEWTAQAGYRRKKGIYFFTLGDNKVTFMGVKVGFSFKRWSEQNRGIVDHGQWYNLFQGLIDLNLEVRPSKSKKFRIEVLSKSFESSTEPVNIVWRDIGWDLGSWTLGGGLQLPEGTQVVVLDFIKVIIQEIAILTEKNGGTYFSLSGGLGLGNAKYSAEIVVYRFRWRIAGNPNAAKFMLDGISFKLKIGTFELAGTGMAGESTINEHLYQELAFALDLKFRALSKNFQIGVFLYKGEVSGTVDNFRYRMFGFKLAFVPAAGGLDLYNVRLMAANNLAPNLPPPDSSEQNLRIFKWYKTSSEPLSVPDNRKMAAWRPQDDSFAFGVGTAAAFGGTKALLLDLFIFGHHSPGDNAFMIAMELFLLKSQKPVGFGVLEVDLESGKWALFVGVSLSFKNVLPEAESIPGLDNVAALSGNLYLGNKPGTFALGQLSDQNTWLAFRMKQEEFFKLDVVVGLCIQFVDRLDGPKGFGAVISAKGGADFGVGKAELYLNFVLIAGMWKNESSTSGLIVVFEAGFRIKLFGFFRFGASVEIQMDFLGPAPEYKRLAFKIHIDTPWYLPDVTIRFEKIYHTPLPERQPLVSTPIISAEAFGFGVRLAGPVLLTALEGTAINEKQLFDLRRLRGLAPLEFPQAEMDDMVAVGVDSTIVLNFKPPVDDCLTIGEDTPSGAGTQAAVPPASSELSVTYELASLSIRRQPRYGPNANQWTSLLAPKDTQLPSLDAWPTDQELQALFSSEIKVLWDRDVQAAGRFDPRRLLVNAETPFTLMTENAEADEAILISQPGWPCCSMIGTPDNALWHRVSYASSQVGQRVHGFQVFTDSQSTLHWLLSPSPLVAPALLAGGAVPVAKLNLQMSRDFAFAAVNFDQPAFQFRLQCFWPAQHRHAFIMLEGFNGVGLISQKTFSLTAGHAGLIEMQDARGFTRILFRFILQDALSATAPKQSEAIEVVSMEYRTVLEQREGLSGALKCENKEAAILAGKGKLAWLPNHNYEITAKTRVKLWHNQTGTQQAELVQRAYFRTKGMVGLNHVDHAGAEVEPYLEVTYPRTDRPIIYREEPIAMAFKEQFNILLPVDRRMDANQPAELNQVLEWDLTVDKEGDPSGNIRISKSNPDWIVENRGNGTTNPYDFTILIGDALVALEREAVSSDPLRRRVIRILSSSRSCNGGAVLSHPRSQVLLHQPIDPSIKNAPLALWEANTAFRVNLKPKAGPFIHRNPFHPDDVDALKAFTEESFSSGAWAFANDSITLAATTTPAMRYYAVFGEVTWDHVQIHVQLDPKGAEAGAAIGVQTSASGVTDALMAVVDEAHRILKVQKWQAGTLQGVQQAPIPPGLTAPYQLTLVAYDDQLEVRLDEVKLVVPRGAIRSGQLALVARNRGTFQRLTVEALDAYVFYFKSSRFASFEHHIQSAGNRTMVIPGGFAGQDEAQIIRQQYAATSTAIAQSMQPGADAAVRLSLFQRWAAALSLPLVQQPKSLILSRLETGTGTALMLLESPEPLCFSDELVIAVEKKVLDLDPVPIPPGLGALQSSIPIELRRLEGIIRDRVRAVRAVNIHQDQVSMVITGGLMQKLPQMPRFALVGLVNKDRLQHLLFSLTSTTMGRNLARIVGLLRNKDDFNVILQQPLIRALARQIRRIQPDHIFLLNDQGVLLEEVKLPELTIPFLVPQHFRLLSNGDESRALLIPLDGPEGVPTMWGKGKYNIQFRLSRSRYPQELVDSNAAYARDVNLELDWT